ncbi:uncharacterized protein LOC119384972 [Rhipicephalus sanguineus]|uniref:uncharacterized protein LOC119384972 n=1 Tax=Rhipicephalus sanguineus TaxID=34632 RepID=UPI0020C2AAC3|nr:uncharacterized protein LOC119384972 [Rhipicephalus sanguineus]
MRQMPREIRNFVTVAPIPKNAHPEHNRGRRGVRATTILKQTRSEERSVSFVDVAAYRGGRAFSVVVVDSKQQITTAHRSAPTTRRLPSKSPSPLPSWTTKRMSSIRRLEVDLRGLLCHSHADGFLGAVIPSSCDFVMVDVPLSPPQRHPLYSYMTTIKFTSASLEGLLLQHMKSAQGTPLLLVVERSVLRSTAFTSQAVIRGLVQKVVDMKGHGVVLSDHEITDADTAEILEDAQTLSDEVQSYHGLIRYDVFFGNRSALGAMMLDVSRKSSITFVYRMSGISRTFTHLYFDNFYSKKMNEENLSSVIDRDLIQPMRQHVGSKSVVISMTLMARHCPKDTVVKFQSNVNCVDIPLNLTHSFHSC